MNNSGLWYRSRFVVLELSHPNSNHVFPSSVNTLLVIDLTVTEGMNAAVSKACAYV